MHTSENYKRIIVARNCNRTTGLTYENLNEKLAYGEVVAVDEKGQLLDTVAKVNAAEGMRLVVGTKDESPIYTDLILKSELSSVRGSKFENKQEQKVIIGYNGTSGSIDAVGGNKYVVEIEHLFNGAKTSETFLTRAAYETPVTGTTQYGIASELANLLSLDYAGFTEGVRVNVITDQVGAGGITGAVVTHGSKTVTYTGGVAPAVGKVIAVPGITGADHRDEDTTLYTVTYVDTVNKVLELNNFYQNRSQTGLAVTIIPDKTVGNYGITLEGMAIKQRKPWEAYETMQFEVTTLGFMDTTITQGTSALGFKPGFGRHEQLNNWEDMFGAASGRNVRLGREFDNTNFNTDYNTGYSMVSLKFNHLSKANASSIYHNKKVVNLFLQRGTYADITADAAGTEFKTAIKTGTGLVAAGDCNSILNVVNAFAVSAGTLGAGANTVSNGGNEMTSATIFSTGVDI